MARTIVAAMPEQMPVEPCALAQPGPAAFFLRDLVDPNGQKVIVMRIEHTTGTTIVSVPAEVAVNMGKDLIQRGSGLQIVQGMA